MVAVPQLDGERVEDAAGGAMGANQMRKKLQASAAVASLCAAACCLSLVLSGTAIAQLVPEGASRSVPLQVASASTSENSATSSAAPVRS